MVISTPINPIDTDEYVELELDPQPNEDLPWKLLAIYGSRDRDMGPNLRARHTLAANDTFPRVWVSRLYRDYADPDSTVNRYNYIDRTDDSYSVHLRLYNFDLFFYFDDYSLAYAFAINPRHSYHTHLIELIKYHTNTPDTSPLPPGYSVSNVHVYYYDYDTSTHYSLTTVPNRQGWYLLTCLDDTHSRTLFDDLDNALAYLANETQTQTQNKETNPCK